jgi:DNA modification methylase
MNLPTSKTRDGYIGIKDFRGDMIRLFQECGFIYHSEVTIWKCPVIAMTRTHALGLLHAQLKKDSAMSRQGIPDYLVTMRKPGENTKPITGELEHFAGDMETFTPTGNLSIDIWQKYASPVWMDINPSNTLQYMCAKQEQDERHICPLQLDVIERALQLWSLPDDLVYSPFTGIGSEGYMALKLKRRFLGTELKESYFNIALNNLKEIESAMDEPDLFDSLINETPAVIPIQENKTPKYKNGYYWVKARENSSPEIVEIKNDEIYITGYEQTSEVNEYFFIGDFIAESKSDRY